jgi:quinol monooxygenase YgiN
MDRPAVIVSVRITAAKEEIRRQLAGLLEPIAAQPGCQCCRLLHDAIRGEVVTMIQEWQTRADMERHLRSQEFWRLLLVAELSSDPPEFRIDTLASREGLEAVVRLRADGTLHR